MKKTLLISMVLVLGIVPIIGCSTSSTSAVAGAIGLTAASRILDDLGNISEREKAIVLASHIALTEEYEAAETETEKIRIEALIKENEKLGEAVKVASEGVNTAKLAIRTDWTNPEQSAPWLVSALMTSIWFFTSKGKKTAEGTLNQLNRNLATYMAGATPEEGAKVDKIINGKT